LQKFYEKQIEKGFPQQSKKDLDESLKKVLSRLKELKYLNDTEYAKDFIENRTISSRPRGKFALRRELKQKGLHPELVERVLSETDLDEETLAIETLKKRMKLFAKDPLRKQKEKAMRFLSSRGFNLDSIYKAVQNCYNDRSSD